MLWVCTLVFMTSVYFKISNRYRWRDTSVNVPNGKTEAQVTTPAIPPQSRMVIHSGFSVPVLSDIKALLLSS